MNETEQSAACLLTIISPYVLVQGTCVGGRREFGIKNVSLAKCIEFNVVDYGIHLKLKLSLLLAVARASILGSWECYDPSDFVMGDCERVGVVTRERGVKSIN
jgi:hypothetical protein